MTIAISSAKWADLSGQGYLNNPFVAWNNLGASATLSGTAVVTGGDRANAVSGSTYDKWRPDVTTSEALLKFDFGSATSINFAAIGAHNSIDYTATVAVEYSTDDITYTDCGAGAVTPSDNKVIAWRFATVSARYWQIKFTSLTSGDDLSVGVAFLGKELVIPRRFYQGFSPVLTPTDVQLQSNVSVGGNLLGGSVISRGSTISAQIGNVDESFIRGTDWLAFQTAFGEGQGFFFAWRPEKYSGDVYYCARSGDVIRPENTGPRDLMSIQMDARVYANG